MVDILEYFLFTCREARIREKKDNGTGVKANRFEVLGDATNKTDNLLSFFFRNLASLVEPL
jgi:hypothetical protein